MVEFLTFPVGRMVAGSLYRASDKDFDGNPLVHKKGPDAGKPRVEYYFGVAIAKGGEQHWNQTEWGAKLWAVGQQAFPQAVNRPDFSWKITDGDSTVMNKRNKRPCDNEGYPGHWVISFRSGFAVDIYNADGSARILDNDAVKPGYFVQVNAGTDGNGNPTNPGIYINPRMVALSAYGPEIVVGPDASSVGFGQSPLPPGASATPVASFTPPASAGATAAAAPATTAVPPPNVTPNHGFVTGAPSTAGAPSTPAAASAPPPPPAAPVRVMTAKATAPYETYIASGWTDAQLIQHGYMQA